MEAITPSVLRDLYEALSRQDKDAFLKLIASTSRDPVMMASALPALEQEKFVNQQCAAAVNIMTPPLLEYAIESAIIFVRKNPRVTDAQIREFLHSQREKWTNDAAKVVVERERERIKQTRDRKSDPETIRRNAEICDLRKQDKKKWSHERLAKKYDVTKQYISNVLKTEGKWRRLMSDLPSDQQPSS